MAPQARIRVGDGDLLLLGTVAGFVPDGERVRQAFEAFGPNVVALGVPAEDLATLDGLAASPVPPDLSDLDEATQKLLTLLAPFGATRLPSPDLQAAHDLSRAGHVELVSLDLDDAEHAAAFTRSVKFWHILQSNSIQAKLLKRGVSGNDAYQVACHWDAAWTAPKGLRRLEEEREARMAQRLRDLAEPGKLILGVVPVPRLAGILTRLTSA